VADGDFKQPWKVLREVRQVVEVEIMPSIQAKANVLSRQGGLVVPIEYLSTLGGAKHTRIVRSIQFNTIGPNLFGSAHLVWIWIEKQAGTNTVSM
jgi:hypothetical protein